MPDSSFLQSHAVPGDQDWIKGGQVIRKDNRFLLEKKSWTSMFQYDPLTLKAASDYRAEQARKDFQRHSLLGRSVLGQLLWELGFILSLPVRAPVFLWGKLRRKR